MASTLLGRAECPECGFRAAHVKISDKEGAKAYRHCPECSAQYFPRNQSQADRLLSKMRPEGQELAPATPNFVDAVIAHAVEVHAPVPPPPPPASYKYVLGVKVPA